MESADCGSNYKTSTFTNQPPLNDFVSNGLETIQDQIITSTESYSSLPKLVISCDEVTSQAENVTSQDNCMKLNDNLNSDENSMTSHSCRRSCDSAYGSSMESNLASHTEDSPAISENHRKANWLDLTTGKSSQSSRCSSPNTEVIYETSSGNDVTATRSSLMLDHQTFFRKLSSASKYSLRSSLSIESEDDLISSDDGSTRKNSPSKTTVKGSSWTKLRRMVIWSPFMQSFKRNYPWVQLAGHSGNFQPGQEGCILKKFVDGEATFLKLVGEDENLCGLAPTFHGVVENSENKFTRMQDLLSSFDAPSIMDCKMGVRTYLEDELAKAKNNPSLRPDMYKKMVETSPDAPTLKEHQQKAVTKPRYMQWRELVSSTSNLGFRIEGIKKANQEPSKDYKLTKTNEQVTSAFSYFIDTNQVVLDKYIERLELMRNKLECSKLFQHHEVIGSSLLFVHDHTNLAGIWMIDFGKTKRLPNNTTNNHRSAWVEGNREDGYLFGLDNLLQIFKDIRSTSKDIKSS